MAVRVVTRRGERRLVIDIRYTNPNGTPARFRRDAEVQTMPAARAEDRRRLAALALTGSPEELLPSVTPIAAESQPDEKAPKLERSSPTFGKVVEGYLADFAPSHLKPSTKVGYEAILDGFLLPKLRNVPIHKIDAGVARRLDVELVKRDLAPSSRRQMQSVIRSVLCRYGVEAGHLSEAPRFPKLPKSGRKILRVMDLDEFRRIMDAAHGAHRIAFLLAAHAGLRAGEIRGLRWRDVDMKSGQLVVRQSICHGVAAPPKSGHERIVPHTPALQKELEAISAKPPDGFVSMSKWKKPWTNYGLRQAFVRTCKRAGVSEWRFHDLRHFFVTTLFKGGVPAPAVQALAGHGALTTTERYAHLARVDLVDAIAALGRMAGVTGG